MPSQIEKWRIRRIGYGTRSVPATILSMRIGSTEIIDTYAEAFGARYTRLIITAAKDYWLDAALRSITGYGTSVIGCDAEAGIERQLTCPGKDDARRRYYGLTDLGRDVATAEARRLERLLAMARDKRLLKGRR